MIMPRFEFMRGIACRAFEIRRHGQTIEGLWRDGVYDYADALEARAYMQRRQLYT